MTHPDASVNGSDVFSSDPERRAIEVAFLRRIVASIEDVQPSVSQTSDPFQADVEKSLVKMQHPVFALLAELIETDMPENQGFSRTRPRESEF
jgi:hypothetical protein